MKRYHIGADYGYDCYEESAEDGPWVKYEDHQAELAELAQLLREWVDVERCAVELEKLKEKTLEALK
jgi:hypothetical protein